MPSFDVVSKVVWMEVDNALQQAKKEIAQRYDFKDTDTSIEKTDEGIVLVSNSEGRLEAALDVLQGKMVKRSVPLKHLDAQEPQPAGGETYRQLVKVKEGISRENARVVVEALKTSRIKVQGAIQGDAVRVSGRDKDDLQAAIRHLRGLELDCVLQFQNFRD